MWGRGRVAGFQLMNTTVHNAHGAQINFRDLTQYLHLTLALAYFPRKSYESHAQHAPNDFKGTQA